MLTLLRSDWPEHDLPRNVEVFLNEAEARAEFVREPSFVPSDYALAWDALSALPRGSICEWGCGLATVAGLACLLGWQASGIEQNPVLVAAARELHSEFDLNTDLYQGDLFAGAAEGDLVYAYMWPELIEPVKAHFSATASSGTQLLLHDAGGRMDLYGLG